MLEILMRRGKVNVGDYEDGMGKIYLKRENMLEN